MAANIRAIINQAHQLCGVIAADEVSDGTDTNIALIKLNEILAQLNIDQLFPYSRMVVDHVCPTIRYKYSIGNDDPLQVADINYERPSFINRIHIYTNANSLPLDIQQLDLPDLLARRTQGSGTPRYFATNPTYPNMEIYFDMAPQTGSILQIIYNKAVPDVTINTVLQIPHEYNEVLVTALARKIAVLKLMPSETVERMDILYKEAISNVKRANSRNQIPTLNDLLDTHLDLRNIYNLG